MFFRHVNDVDGITSNTYTLDQALVMASKWAPRFNAKASFVPAGVVLRLSLACADDFGPPTHGRCPGSACSCACHGLRERASERRGRLTFTTTPQEAT